MEHDITKLPKWAQQRIKYAEQTASEALEREKRTVEGDTNVWIDKGYRRDRQPLPEHTRILFELEDGSISVSVEDGKVYVMAIHGGLSVYPRSSNTLSMEVYNY